MPFGKMVGTEMVGITGNARDESGGGHSLLSSSDRKMGIASLLCMKKVDSLYGGSGNGTHSPSLVLSHA